MSLVITSNQFLENSGNYNSAFSYRNALRSTTRIPANSEIAVQSVKVNKNGTLTLTKQDALYQYFNKRPTIASPIEKSTGQVHLTQAKFVPSDANVLELSTIDFASRLQSGLNNNIFHPEMTGLITCNACDTISGFQGFDVKYNQRNASVVNYSASLLPTDFYNPWGIIYPTAGLTYDPATKRLRMNVSGNAADIIKLHNVATLTQPISLIDGGYTINVSGTRGSSGSNWTCGLTRSVPLNMGNGVDYFNVDRSVGYRKFDYYDYKITAEQQGSSDRYLHVYHSVSVPNPFTGNDVLALQEIEYWTIAGNPFAGTGPYNFSANASAIDSVLFKAKNEIVEIHLYAGATEYKLIQYDSTRAKSQNFKPIAETCRYLYPKFHIDSTSSAPADGKFMEITDMKIHTNYIFGDEDQDWWAYLTFNNMIDDGYEVDMRFFNDMADPELYVCNGLTTKLLTDYSNTLIVAPDNTIFPNTPDATMSSLLGYVGQSIILPTEAFPLETFSSTAPPVVKSNTSLFVRLNNMGFSSINAGVGATSKILYSLPRFSQDGSTTGTGLYFEPASRVYLPLNNPNDITINEFSVDFVNENETLASDLSGKSVVIFHIKSAM